MTLSHYHMIMMMLWLNVLIVCTNYWYAATSLAFLIVHGFSFLRITLSEWAAKARARREHLLKEQPHE